MKISKDSHKALLVLLFFDEVTTPEGKTIQKMRTIAPMDKMLDAGSALKKLGKSTDVGYVFTKGEVTLSVAEGSILKELFDERGSTGGFLPSDADAVEELRDLFKK